MSEKKQQNMIDEATVQKIAHLARIQISAEERAQYSAHLSQALNHFEKIKNIATEGVEPMVTPVEIEFVYREDVVDQELTTSEIMSNAPSSLGHLFKVPPVV